MSISCKIIEDLLPLYHDGVCSEESKEMVENHLKECEQCQSYFKIISNENFEQKININTDEVKVNAMKNLKKQLARKNVKVSILSILSVIGILIVSYPLIFKLELPINYSEGLIGVQSIADDNTEFRFLEDDFYRCHHLQRIVEIDGVEKNVLMIYYTNTLWTKLSPKQQFMKDSINYFTAEKAAGWTEGNWEKIYVDDSIDAVYYMVGDYDKLFDKSLDKLSENVLNEANLLWEK